MGATRLLFLQVNREQQSHVLRKEKEGKNKLVQEYKSKQENEKHDKKG